VTPPLPVLDTDTAHLARVYARDTDPAGLVIAALMAHTMALETVAKALSARVDRDESHALEQARNTSVCASPTPMGWIA
jgi:hypothetical protein